MPEPTNRDIHAKAGQGVRKRWQAEHDLTCWRHHTDCALARARDLEISRREHAAARAHLFGDAAARAVRMDMLTRHEELGEVIAAARAALEEQYASVTNRHHRRPRPAQKDAG